MLKRVYNMRENIKFKQKIKIKLNIFVLAKNYLKN